ncbi:MAG: ROK family protein [Verrucomicrobiales bacterium]|jgi:glucokinase|nr:ROK family protein [Verrucomicrobiales bacterium]
MQATLTVDMGGTRVKLGLARGGVLLWRETLEARSERGLAQLLERLAPLVRAQARGAELAGLGVAFPSLIEPRTGRVLAAYGKYADAPGIDLPAWARREFGLPLAVDNDARCALLGEWRYGAARGRHDAVLVTLGTGIGVATLLDGQLLRGRHGPAGNFGGHLTVNLHGQRCTCGNIGCAEAEASTAALPRLFAATPGREHSALTMAPRLDYAAVFAAAADGDAAALALRAHSLRVWSALTVNLIHAYAPELVLLGGGIMRSAAVILPYVRDYVARHAHTPWGEVTVSGTALGDDAALLGCEVLSFLQREHGGIGGAAAG